MSIITTGYPDVTSSCKGTAGVNTFVVVNNTPIDQSFTVTDNSRLANNMTFYPVWETDIDETNCANGSPLQSSANYNVPAGKTLALNVAAGGYTGPDSFMSGQEHNLSIGGGGNPTEWYDLWFSEDINSSYNSWGIGL